MSVKYYYDSENLAGNKKHEKKKIWCCYSVYTSAALFGFQFYRFIEYSFWNTKEWLQAGDWKFKIELRHSQ
jgi:hypothetical protein